MLAMIGGVARHLLTAGGGYLSANGLTTADEVNTGVGAILTLGGFAWSVYRKWKDKKEA